MLSTDHTIHLLLINMFLNLIIVMITVRIIITSIFLTSSQVAAICKTKKLCELWLYSHLHHLQENGVWKLQDSSQAAEVKTSQENELQAC